MSLGIIVDTAVIKQSSEKFIYSDIGDLASKITAIHDWLFEEQAGKTTVDAFAVMISKKSVNSVVRIDFSNINERYSNGYSRQQCAGKRQRAFDISRIR